MVFTVLFISISISPGEILEEHFGCLCRVSGLPILGFTRAPNTRFPLQTLYGRKNFSHAGSTVRIDVYWTVYREDRNENTTQRGFMTKVEFVSSCELRRGGWGIQASSPPFAQVSRRIEKPHRGLPVYRGKPIKKTPDEKTISYMPLRAHASTDRHRRFGRNPEQACNFSMR